MYNGTKYVPSSVIPSVYYSGVTFFSLGYGDIVPYGDRFRIIAVIEVCLGVFFIVSFFTSGLNLIQENKKQSKWKPLENTALGLIGSSLWNLSTDILHLYKDENTFVSSEELSNKRISVLFNQKQAEYIRKLAKTEESELIELISHDNIKMYYEFEVRHTLLFEEYRDNISNLELKYGDYLDTEKRLILIKIQEELNSLILTFKLKEGLMAVNKANILEGFNIRLVKSSKVIFMELEKAIELKIIDLNKLE